MYMNIELIYESYIKERHFRFCYVFEYVHLHKVDFYLSSNLSGYLISNLYFSISVYNNSKRDIPQYKK